MKTEERMYGKIIVDIPQRLGRTVTYYILHSEDVYGLKMKESDKDGIEPRTKSVVDVSPSLDEVERLADLMLSEFVSFSLFEDVIKDNVSHKS